MAYRLALSGTTTQRTGTTEASWLIVFDMDRNGMNIEAKLKDTSGTGTALMFRDGMNTYVGVLDKASAAKGPWPCRGLYYHDSDGGPSGHVPRGTFNLRAYEVEKGRIVCFDGSYSDDAVSGSHTSVVVEFQNDARTPTNCEGCWDEATNTLTVLHGSRLFVGKWSNSQSNVEKWAGVFYQSAAPAPKMADFDLAKCPEGTFLLFPTELSDE
ncbi:hypothetical protein DIPPA_26002 [Diplonema papillatum]|nr:hypothetical protein DIPPA_26002 [Diplonema papillatum]